MHTSGANRIDLGASSRRRSAGLGWPVRLVVGVLAATLASCGEREERAETQPAPNVTTFEQGAFDDIPLFPRSEPVGPRSEKEGVVARSYRARGATPQGVLEYYRDALDERRWELVGDIEELGVGTYQADWVSGDRRLRVSATREPALGGEAPSDQVVVQYSLTLRPA